jgi:hypothetical protein
MRLLKHVLACVIFGSIAYGLWLLLPGEPDISFLWWLALWLGVGVASYIAYIIANGLEQLWGRR